MKLELDVFTWDAGQIIQSVNTSEKTSSVWNNLNNSDQYI